jgi:spore germination protein YaaH
MFKKILIILSGLALGLASGYFLITYIFPPTSQNKTITSDAKYTQKSNSKEVIGFLPYWFLTSAKPSYAGYITTLDYFSLTPDKDGTILKYTAPGESEPGYLALTSGKFDSYLDNAKAANIKLALTIFDGDQDRIKELVNDPITNANNLMNDLAPIITQYGFTDLNMDIENIGIATGSAQVNYTSFVQEVHKQIALRDLNVSLSMDLSPIDFVQKDHLANTAELSKYLDKVIIMAYDFHSPSSFVTGPVAPLYGTETVAEFDTEVGVKAALKNYDPSKIILGVPFYGYSWETLDNFERAAAVPSSSYIISNKDAETLLNNCATCSAQFDEAAEEKYIIYKNSDSGTYQQIFYPDSTAIASKISFVKGNSLSGIAIWALGYEGNTILNPIKDYLR